MDETKPKVLLISLFHPELLRGGAQQVCYELFEGYRSKGIDATLLASVDRASYPSLFKSGARITGFDQRPNEYLFLTQDYDYLWHKTSAPTVIGAFIEFLHEVSPDVVHFHHFFTLGIDLITLTRKILPKAKIVFTFHEFMSICEANGQMVRRTDGSLCTHASQVRCHQCFPDRSPEQFLMRELWMKSHLECVDSFTTPTRFMIEQYVRWGIPREKIHHVTNGQLHKHVTRKTVEGRDPNRFGFFGQIVDNKGVHVLLDAVDILRAEEFEDFVIEINGENIQYASEPIRERILAFKAAEEELPVSDRRVFFNGGYHTSDLDSRMNRVDWVIVPSIWWEIFCLVISEAWAHGKPVLCSDVGGPAERVAENIGGHKFPVGDARALAELIKRLSSDQEGYAELVKRLPSPPDRSEMVEGFLALYSAIVLPEPPELPKPAEVKETKPAAPVESRRLSRLPYRSDSRRNA